MRLKSICLFCFFIISSKSFSQEKIDTSFEELINTLNSNLPILITDHKVDSLIQTKKNENIRGDLYHELGKYYYLNNKRVKEAIFYTQKAIEYKGIEEKEYYSINKSLNNLIIFYKENGQIEQALTQSKKLINNNQKDRYTLKAYIEIKNNYLREGDYHTALIYLNEAVFRFKETADLYKIYIALSHVYSEMESLSAYHQSLKILDDIIKEKSLSVREKVEIYSRYGFIYDELEFFDKAVLFYNKAIQTGLQKIKEAEIAILYNDLGYIYARKNQEEKAYQNYKLALRYDIYNTSVYDNLGDYYLRKKEFIKSLSYYQKAIDFDLGNFEDSNYLKIPQIAILLESQSKIELINDLKDKANAWLLFYKEEKNTQYLKEALKTIKLADKLIDIVRVESIEQASKYFWRKEGIDLYMLATSICYELKENDSAFYFMEKSKSLTLLEEIREREARDNTELPEIIIAKENRLKREIYELKHHNNGSEFEKEEGASLLLRKKEEYQKFINSLEVKYPNYYRYKRKQDIATLNYTKQYAKDNEAIVIQYLMTDNVGYGMLINESSHVMFFKIKGIEKLKDDIKKLNIKISKPLTKEREFDEFEKLAIAIRKKLIPIKEISKDITGKKLIVISSDGLQNLPFETLIDEAKENELQKRFLINHADISYLYAMSLYKASQKISRRIKNQIVGFAPVTFEKDSLSPLFLSEIKMREIHRMFSNDFYIKTKATKTEFKEQATRHKLIHLSTHAGAKLNEEPWIAFKDDKLKLSELYFIKNQSDLTFLDACKTGVGKLQEGEGIMSLTRGFLYSGAKSVVSSLWNTNEKSSHEIIIDFYTSLKKNHTTSRALREAKLKYLDSHQLDEISPYYWAPLILIGNGQQTLDLTTTDNKYYYILSLIILIMSCLFFIYLRKRKHDQIKKYIIQSNRSKS